MGRLDSLTRIFSAHSAISIPPDFNYEEDTRPIRDILGIGTRQENVTTVLTDLKNFSSLVKASLPDDLNELMGKYYFEARDLVWKYIRIGILSGQLMIAGTRM